MYRHGDVIILDAVQLPQQATRRESNIVAEGEVTGHAHRLSGGEVWESDSQLLLVGPFNLSFSH